MRTCDTDADMCTQKHTYINHNAYVHTYIHTYIDQVTGNVLLLRSLLHDVHTYIHTYTDEGNIHAYIHTYIHTQIKGTARSDCCASLCCAPCVVMHIHTYIHAYIHTQIKGTARSDCCASLCCAPCVVCQIARDVKTRDPVPVKEKLNTWKMGLFECFGSCYGIKSCESIICAQTHMHTYIQRRKRMHICAYVDMRIRIYQGEIG